MLTNEEQTSAIPKEKRNGAAFRAEVLKGNYELWQELGSEVLSLHETVVRDFLPRPTIEQEQRVLEWDFCQPSSHIVFLRRLDNDKLIGFTYAKPYESNFNRVLRNQAKREMKALGLSLPEYTEIYNSSAEVGWTVILAEHRSQGGWSRMMDKLEESLRSEQKYKYMIREVREANNYTQKVKSRYDQKIKYEDRFSSRLMGPQSYMRIEL